MCWSSQVSLFFASLEWAAAGYMLKRNLPRDRPYGLFLATIATMETFQLFIWLSIDSNLPTLNAIFSFIEFVVVWLGIPFSVINWISHFPDQRKRQNILVAFYIVEWLVILACHIKTGIWQTTVGVNGHQVWPCAGALHGVGGHTLYYFISLCYGIGLPVAYWPLGKHPKATKSEKIECVYWAISGGITWFTIYGVLGNTLEACSTWCWNAFVFGFYGLLRPYFHKIEAGCYSSASDVAGKPYGLPLE